MIGKEISISTGARDDVITSDVREGEKKIEEWFEMVTKRRTRQFVGHFVQMCHFPKSFCRLTRALVSASNTVAYKSA